MNDLIDLSKGEIRIFSENGANQVEVILQDDSIWLSAEKIGQLFDNKDRSTIQRHIKNIYADDGLCPTLCSGSVVKNGLNIRESKS